MVSSYILKIVLLIFAMLTTCTQAKDQTAMKDIQVIIPYHATSGLAQFFRILQSYGSSKNLNLIPIYKPGAEALVGMNDAASGRHNPNTTVLLTVVSEVTSTHPLKKFDRNYFTPVSALAQPSVYIVASNQAPVNNLRELLTLMKNDPSRLSWAITNAQFKKDLMGIAGQLNIPPEQMIVSTFNGTLSTPLLAGGFIDIGIYPAGVIAPFLENKQVKLLGTYRKIDVPGPDVDYLESHMDVLKRNGYGLFLLPGNQELKFWQDFCKDFLDDPRARQQLKGLYMRIPENGDRLIHDIIKKFSQTNVSLTPREEEIARLIKVRGLSNRQISKQLGIGESAVKVHVTQILKKYHLRSRTQLAAITNEIG